MPVEVAVARTDTVVDAILATGQIEALQSIELRPDIEGRHLADSGAGGKSRRARARRSSRWMTPSSRHRWPAPRPIAIWPGSRSTRTRDLLGQQASSQAELERAEATARSNEAQLALLKVRLARTTVRAPFAGVAGQRFVSLGDYVTTDTRLLALQTVSPQRAILPGARAVCRSTQVRPAGDVPGGGAARQANSPAGWISWIPWFSFQAGPSW